MSAQLSQARFLTALSSLALLAGCTTVGPKWHGAPVTAPDAAARGAFVRGPGVATANPPSPRWWETFGDPVLDNLITQALAGSPDLAAAKARIDQSRANLSSARAARLPSASVGVLAAEADLPGTILSRSGRLSEQVYADNIQASWEIDLFGGTSRKIEGARFRAAAAEASTDDIAVTLSAEIARDYVMLRAQQAIAAVLIQQVDCDTRLLTAAQQRFSLGTAGQQAVNNAQSALAQSQSDLADTHVQVTVLADQLAVLSGREPGTLDTLITTPGAVPLVPANVAVGDPARLLRHRPDIRMAEDQLAAANADVGAKMADRLPSISFTGILGLGGTNVGDAFSPSSLIALLLPQLKWNLFDGGRAKAAVVNARGARAEAEANYRTKVLAALQDAENSLTRFGGQRITLAKAIEQHDSAVHTATLEADRAAGGTLSRADAISAQRQTLRAQLNTLSATAQLSTDFIAVEKALGLGWETQEPAK